jgi:hypothetical protein
MAAFEFLTLLRRIELPDSAVASRTQKPLPSTSIMRKSKRYVDADTLPVTVGPSHAKICQFPTCRGLALDKIFIRVWRFDPPQLLDIEDGALFDLDSF